MKKIKLISFLSFLFISSGLIGMTLTTPKILFLTLKIEKDKLTRVESVRIIKQILVDGQLKQTTADTPTNSKSILVLSFLGENEESINQIEVENPFSKNIESFNLDGTIQRHDIEENQIEFNIRINYEDSMKMLRVSKKEAQKQTYTISNITLKLQ
jgi:hypothetical protein